METNKQIAVWSAKESGLVSENCKTQADYIEALRKDQLRHILKHKDAKREERKNEYSTNHQIMYMESFEGSRKSAIRTFCIQCMGYSGSEVKECTSVECPLYEFRLH